MQDQQCKDIMYVGPGRCRQEIQIAPETPDPLYEKAFYSLEEDTDSEYARNTTAWD